MPGGDILSRGTVCSSEFLFGGSFGLSAGEILRKFRSVVR